MTYEEAVALKRYKNLCNCGGYATGMTERSESEHPHMPWCAQHDEWEEWKAAMNRGERHE